MNPSDHPVTMPTARPAGCPFDPPVELAGLRAEQPLRPLRYPDGHLGWDRHPRAPRRPALQLAQ